MTLSKGAFEVMWLQGGEQDNGGASGQCEEDQKHQNDKQGNKSEQLEKRESI